MKFSEKIVIIRKKYGLSQTKFANGIGVSRQAVYKWEAGQSYPEVAKLLEIKLQYNISLDELLDDNFVLPLPEKKRKKRISKAVAAELEANVRREEAGIAPAPVAEEVKAAPAPAAEEVKAAPAPKAEPVPEAKPEPKAEPVMKAEPAPEKAEPEEVKTEPITRAEKASLFDRLFGKH